MDSWASPFTSFFLEFSTAQKVPVLVAIILTGVRGGADAVMNRGGLTEAALSVAHGCTTLPVLRCINLYQKLRWPRSFEQNLRVDKWSLGRG